MHIALRACIFALLFYHPDSWSQSSQSTWGTQFNAGTRSEEDPGRAYEQARRAYELGDYRGVMEIATPWAERGDAVSQYAVGKLYYDGKGTAQNYAKAAEWFRKAADQSLAAAQFYLGYMYLMGEGLAKDPKIAAGWIGRAADQGFVGARRILGLMYKNGDGVPRNLSAAYALLHLAAEQGDEQATEARASLIKHMSAEQLQEGQRIVRDLTGGTDGIESPAQSSLAAEAQTCTAAGLRYKSAEFATCVSQIAQAKVQAQVEQARYELELQQYQLEKQRYELEKQRYEAHMAAVEEEKRQRKAEFLMRFGAALAGGTSGNFATDLANAGREATGLPPLTPPAPPPPPILQNFTIRNGAGHVVQNCQYRSDLSTVFCQ
jgi:TPR repeat protein